MRAGMRLPHIKPLATRHEGSTRVADNGGHMRPEARIGSLW